ncbi:hypothetical protein HME9302_00381 [Alteripontixanthobacter maritimus]|uniref:DUF4230 domain-containing protein n=1 Tax=Alteripontixanthobacter maritimus TaxID=2161824 RepID=A0A369Q7P8_9SPHN|nr:DUF4230 domain-containing protein [Alteripontixanthobacter maritimus]RDC59196.1 hypothetical protein HME9302_00381 [Alteripontixanthobacter maritimus]
MANDTLTRDDPAATHSIPEPAQEKPLARVQGVPWLIVIVLLAAVAWLGWRAFFYEEEGDPVGSAMLAFEKQNSLIVFSSRFEVVAESTNTTSLAGFDLMKSRQASIIPATVEYRVNLASVGRDRIAWDEATETLDVTIPQLKISRPNLDEGAARVFTEGTYVSRNAAQSLSQSNSRQAERRAVEFAKNPEVLALARTAAKDAIRQNLAIPMQVAGYGDVKVNVRFDGEEKTR